MNLGDRRLASCDGLPITSVMAPVGGFIDVSPIGDRARRQRRTATPCMVLMVDDWSRDRWCTALVLRGTSELIQTSDTTRAVDGLIALDAFWKKNSPKGSLGSSWTRPSARGKLVQRRAGVCQSESSHTTPSRVSPVPGCRTARTFCPILLELLPFHDPALHCTLPRAA